MASQPSFLSGVEPVQCMKLAFIVVALLELLSFFSFEVNGFIDDARHWLYDLLGLFCKRSLFCGPSYEIISRFIHFIDIKPFLF